MSSQTPLTTVVDFLRRHAPFDQMAPAHLEHLAKRLKLGFYAKNEIITGPDDGPADRFYLIKQGRIRGEDAGSQEGAWELVDGECFPIGALLARRPVSTYNRAVEDTFCFELDSADFDLIRGKSAIFQDFCTRRLANLLDNALRGVQASLATRASEDTSLSTPLRALLQRRPVTCRPETPLSEALQRMHEHAVGSIVVVDPAESPSGMFTLHDVLSRVTLPQHSLTAPIAEVMTPTPLSLPPDALAYEAALLMAQEGFGHICVVEHGRLIGVVSERDLFSLQRIGLVNLSRAISQAPSVSALTRMARDIHRLVEQMLAQGGSVEQITKIITALNDSLTQRVISLMISEAGQPDVEFSWLSFGSEGRYEQTLKTDQDNGILFITPTGRSADEVRAMLLPLAHRINQALAECGFPLCPGNIMAQNPECCLSLEEWQARFSRWVDQGTPQHLLQASIFFDFRPLFGATGPAEELRGWLTGRVAQNSRFRRQMAENSLRNSPPLGLLRDFRLSSRGAHPHTLDLKVQGLAPFVDGARILSFAHHITETNTIARLRAAARVEALSRADVEAWAEAYHYIQLLRMRMHRQQAEDGAELSNHVDPDTLNELDRRILKEAFRQARKLQTKLTLEYQL